MISKRRRVLKAAWGAGLGWLMHEAAMAQAEPRNARPQEGDRFVFAGGDRKGVIVTPGDLPLGGPDRKSTRLNSSHRTISYAVFCLKKKKVLLPLIPFQS